MEEKTLDNNQKTLIGIVIGIIALVILVIFIKGCTTNNKYTVTFDSDGGTEVSEQTLKANDTLTIPADPVKEGYTFAGWYLDDELFDFTTKIDKNITLIAKWYSKTIELESDSLSLTVGDKVTLKIKALPEGVKLEDLVFETSDGTILTVSEDGVISGLKAGKTTVTVKTKDGSYNTPCEVTVTNGTVNVKSITINGNSSVTVGGSIKLTVTFDPSDATDKTVTWKSSDPSIATVDSDGNVKGLKAGKVTITVTSKNGVKATKTINVTAAVVNETPTNPGGSSGGGNVNPPSDVPVTDIGVTGPTEVYVGESITLTATIAPGNATNKNITWSIDDNTTASLATSGGLTATLTGVKPGTVTITVVASNGVSKTYTVTVKEKEARYELHLAKIQIEGMEGLTYQYTFKVTKNGEPFTDYKGFTLNGNGYRAAVGEHATVSSKHVLGSGDVATITLPDNQVKTLYVIFD